MTSVSVFFIQDPKLFYGMAVTAGLLKASLIGTKVWCGPKPTTRSRLGKTRVYPPSKGVSVLARTPHAVYL